MNMKSDYIETRNLVSALTVRLMGRQHLKVFFNLICGLLLLPIVMIGLN